MGFTGNSGSSTFTLTSVIAETTESVRTSHGTIKVCGYNNVDSLFFSGDRDIYYHRSETKIEFDITTIEKDSASSSLAECDFTYDIKINGMSIFNGGT